MCIVLLISQMKQ